jgi:hypothetical protein
MGPVVKRQRTLTKIVAAIALCLLIVGGVAHQHTVTSGPEHCTACALGHTTSDAPLAIAPEIDAPPAQSIDLFSRAPSSCPRAITVLSLAPKTSPPRA